jgi:hypothetical protein
MGILDVPIIIHRTPYPVSSCILHARTHTNTNTHTHTELSVDTLSFSRSKSSSPTRQRSTGEPLFSRSISVTNETKGKEKKNSYIATQVKQPASRLLFKETRIDSKRGRALHTPLDPSIYPESIARAACCAASLSEMNLPQTNTRSADILMRRAPVSHTSRRFLLLHRRPIFPTVTDCTQPTIQVLKPTLESQCRRMKTSPTHRLLAWRNILIVRTITNINSILINLEHFPSATAWMEWCILHRRLSIPRGLHSTSIQ